MEERGPQEAKCGKSTEDSEQQPQRCIACVSGCQLISDNRDAQTLHAHVETWAFSKTYPKENKSNCENVPIKERETEENIRRIPTISDGIQNGAEKYAPTKNL